MGLLLHGLCSAHHDVRRVERVFVSAVATSALAEPAATAFLSLRHGVERVWIRMPTDVYRPESRMHTAVRASVRMPPRSLLERVGGVCAFVHCAFCVATLQRDEKGATRPVRTVL